ncbi:uncharacterized protein LOC125011625 isoform X2 [Mugil cephalus]|uniref:uncharacterized protein LOC125011625 isoform X2 n=1 Tax=Mugil cephalus TaxID=48193 RepID=UPI001FB5C498|nr:uncharacterized protein LOC125011625 isoform X2 [Mugil cephalus]
MAKYVKTTQLRFHPVRRFPIMWMKNMVKKEVAKQISELRSELLLKHLSQKKEMLKVIQEQLRKLVRDEEIPMPPRYRHCMTPRWKKKLEEEYTEDTDEDEEDADKLLRPRRPTKLGYHVFETFSDTDSTCILPLHSDDYIGDSETGDVLNDAHTSSQSNHKFSSDVTTVISQVMKELEEEASSDYFFPSPSLRAGNIREEEEKAQADKINKEEALLMESQWMEWMDRQETRGSNNRRGNPVEQQGAAASHVAEAEIRRPLTAVDSINKMKTRLCDYFIPHRWERFEDED